MKSVLGRGLSVLIPSSDDSRLSDEPRRDSPSTRDHTAVRRDDIDISSADERHAREDGSVRKIAIDRIVPNPLQPRKDFSAEALRELSESIREHGIVQAVTVRKIAGNKYELISGERRLRAAQEVGLEEIPAYVLDVSTDSAMLEMAIIENVQREQLNPMEEAEAYERLIEECSLTQEEVAAKISKDRATVANMLRLLKLPNEIQDSLRKGELSIGHAKAIMPLADPTKQIELWKLAVHNRLSVRKTEELARQTSPNERGSKPDRNIQAGDVPQVSSEVRQIENELKQLFGTQVKVRPTSIDEGEIRISYYSTDDLERVCELLISLKQ